MLGHRRPKAVDVSYNSTTLRIYYWHAPLGQDTKLYSSNWRSQYQSRRRQVDLQNRQRFIERGRIVPRHRRLDASSHRRSDKLVHFGRSAWR